jgi:hypothetical protein
VASAGELGCSPDAYSCLKLACLCIIKEIPRMGHANSVMEQDEKLKISEEPMH